MGRRKVVEIQCDRCTRTEHIPEDKVPPETKGTLFSGEFEGVKVSFKDLCSVCREIIKSRWGEIAKELTKASPGREKKKPVATEKKGAKGKSST